MACIVGVGPTEILPAPLVSFMLSGFHTTTAHQERLNQLPTRTKQQAFIKISCITLKQEGNLISLFPHFANLVAIVW